MKQSKRCSTHSKGLKKGKAQTAASKMKQSKGTPQTRNGWK